MDTSDEFENREIIVTENSESVASTGAELLFKAALNSIKESGFFSIALSGGSTPKALYSLLADSSRKFKSSIPWEKVHFFWGDERHVPPAHPESNYNMVKESLLSKIDINRKNIHPIPTVDTTPQTSAWAYEDTLKDFFRLGQGEAPSFDLILLGMGNDGHTASLFPGSILLDEKDRLVMADPTPRLNYQRISLTPPVLNNASLVLFLVSGQEKAETLKEVMEGTRGRYPAQLVSPVRGKLIWVIDRAAAELLTLHSKGL